MAERIEFGYPRTYCGCRNCQTNCRFIPGFLIPSDLERMIPKDHSVNPFDWAKQNLLASPGALILRNGVQKRIPTLVPAVNRETGACKFFQDGQCTIHAVAPFGCAFFDCREDDADDLSLQGLYAIEADWEQNGLYAQIWRFLDLHNKRQKAPEVLRKRMAAELTRIR